MTAMPLVEYAKASDTLTQGIVELYVQTSDILQRLSVDTISGGAYRYNLESTLPGIAFRGINETYTPDYSIENPQVETTFVLGGEADVDVAVLTRHGEERRGRETNRKVKKMARVWTDKFINGDNTSEPREFDGLKRRITGSQLIHSSTGSGGDPLSLAKLDQLMDQVTGDATSKAFLMAPGLRRRFWQLIRNTSVSGYIMETRDSLGRPQVSYAGIPIIIGFEPSGPDTAPIAFDEVGNGGGSAVTSSIYLIDFGAEGVMGIQDAPIRTQDFGELESAPVKRVRIEGTAGIVIENPYSVARLTSITDAAIVA